jgi:heavy metal sensor kinase
MRQALDHHLAEDLEVAAEMLVSRGGMLVWGGDADRDLGYDAGPRRWVEVYDTGGRAVFVRGLPSRDEIRAALDIPSSHNEGYRTLETPAGAHVRALTARRAITGDTFWMRVIRREDDLRGDLQRLVLLLSGFAVLATTLAAFAGYAIAGRALLPLKRMAERARAISADRLSERLPVENPRDELGQLAVVFNDTFARLDESFRRLRQFTADASPELRTPLTAIRSVGEVGLREGRSPDAYREIIGSMLEEADHLGRLVDTLLMLSRWESDRFRPSPSAVDLAQIVTDVAGQLSVLAEDRGITVVAHTSQPMLVRTDPVLARQALANVIDNAIKFTRDGGCVHVEVGRADADYCITVDDEGPGIPVEERRRVLERFYRIEGTQGGGSGLGLAIVRQAMMASQGRIEIGDSPSGGARVMLVWPLQPHGAS